MRHLSPHHKYELPLTALSPSGRQEPMSYTYRPGATKGIPAVRQERLRPVESRVRMLAASDLPAHKG